MEIRKEFISHFLTTIVYFIVISLFNLRLGFTLACFWLGALLGAFLLDVDHLILAFNPETQADWAKKARLLFEQKKYQKALLVCCESHLQHRQLIFHSVFGQFVLLIMGFFVLTSTGSLFGTGLVMSMNLHLLKDEWQSFWENKEMEFVFWQIKKPVTPEGQKKYLWLASFVFLLLSLRLL